MRICQETARESEVDAFGHAIQKALAAGLEARREADHAGSTAACQFIRAQAIFPVSSHVNGADPACPGTTFWNVTAKGSPDLKIRIQLEISEDKHAGAELCDAGYAISAMHILGAA